jgi:hypothetical protein
MGPRVIAAAALSLATTVGDESAGGQLAGKSYPLPLSGTIELSSTPSGALLLLTIDLPLAGTFDGLADQVFILLDGTQFIDRIKGAGTINVHDGEVVELSLDRGGRWLLGTEASLSSGRSAADVSARKIRVDRFKQYWAPSKDPSIPHGSPGTGTITHLAQEQPLFAVNR